MADKSDERLIAEWMLGEFEKKGELFQVDAVMIIEKNFGAKFIGSNDNGNQSISPKVLSEFRKLTEGSVVWSRSEFCWKRKASSDSGRLTE